MADLSRDFINKEAVIIIILYFVFCNFATYVLKLLHNFVQNNQTLQNNQTIKHAQAKDFERIF